MPRRVPGRKAWGCVGKFSRDKGARGERALVMFLNDLKYTNVRRVPLSGAMAGYKHDVVATNLEGTNLTFELKCRKELFNWVYAYFKDMGPRRISYLGKCLSMGKSPEEANASGFDKAFQRVEGTGYEKLAKRFFNLDKMREGADYLVIKSDFKSLIFFKFWG